MENGAADTVAAVSVLLVDEQVIWRKAVKAMLQDTEFEVVGEASSGTEALQVARTTCPQLTLLDIRLAGCNGLETLTALKKELPLMRVVMLSTYDNPAFIERARADGAAGYVVKGVDRNDLLAALRAACA